MTCDARELFMRQRRFDLIFKWLFVVKPGNAYVRKAYLESIRAFNGFVEGEPSDGIPKDTPDKFCQSFSRLVQSMRKDGFCRERGIIPIGDNGEISDGAHRLSVAAALGLQVETESDGRSDLYDWNFFSSRQMSPDVMDYGAMEYVRLNPNAYVVNLHAVADPARDEEVEAILNEVGFVYYKKSLTPTYNGYVNLKKLSYGSFWEREPWIGTAENSFAGAQMHAKASMGDGKNPLRAYVFVCDSAEKVVAAKARIREIYKIGNFSVHINDTREEAVWLAETYFNKNSWDVINHRPFCLEDARFDGMMRELKDFVSSRGGSLGDVCATASTVLNVLGLRRCEDFDFLAREGSGLSVQTEETLSTVVEPWLQYYPLTPDEIIDDPSCHFYFQGVKFASPEIICEMKRQRQSGIKDRDDILLISQMFRPCLRRRVLLSLRKVVERVMKFAYSKEKLPHGVRYVRLFGARFSYRRKLS